MLTTNALHLSTEILQSVRLIGLGLYDAEHRIHRIRLFREQSHNKCPVLAPATGLPTVIACTYSQTYYLKYRNKDFITLIQ